MKQAKQFFILWALCFYSFSALARPGFGPQNPNLSKLQSLELNKYAYTLLNQRVIYEDESSTGQPGNLPVLDTYDPDGSVHVFQLTPINNGSDELEISLLPIDVSVGPVQLPTPSTVITWTPFDGAGRITLKPGTTDPEAGQDITSWTCDVANVGKNSLPYIPAGVRSFNAIFIRAGTVWEICRASS